MMGCSAATLAVIILSGFINLSAAHTCEFYALGQDVSLPFEYKELTKTHVLKWTHNKTSVYSSNNGKVTVGKKEDISPSGSLLLKNLQFSGAGTYEATVLNSGSVVANWSRHICVMEKVSKPLLTYVCDSKSGSVTLNCNVNNPQSVKFSWTQDNTSVTGKTGQTLAPSLLKGEGTFICRVENKVSTKSSDVVHLTCKSPLNCFTSKPVMAVLAGGGGLILVLLIIIVILCCRHKHNKSQVTVGDMVVLRTASVKQQDFVPSSPDYETMNATEDYPRLSPKPSPRGCYNNVSEPEGQTQDRPVQLSTAEERRDPSPVPKPRTKGPLKLNV
ncbi:Carcinoembryonic antigen-related cell adhesion molecule 21 Precursor [Channa argus]|uniref:Carcinoembryonic antigen-related cell adhesion molecule 21 n=1 Tax=Channa argus TaxID=215402 RepID=A0A6G1PEE7_CHAAH|nr:Carcinoembryonic antigen-related cell adhesion molecule 21 Precursor [Channa argus]KAK2917630.1 hypothetical protein Q8A73_004376 [Channa argus]